MLVELQSWDALLTYLLIKKSCYTVNLINQNINIKSRKLWPLILRIR